MPINKDALKRYRIIDKLLADPNCRYTTEQIMRKVNAECDSENTVTLRMIQKDIKTIEEEFGKELDRKCGRGRVCYVDQSTPLFYQQLTSDEEELLRNVLKTLGQFEGLDNFPWIDVLKKKLDITSSYSQPLICFSKNDGLQIRDTLLGRLFTAISRKKVIRINYTVFGQQPKDYIVCPYQLRQFNDRWFLLSTPLENDEFQYDPYFICPFALDRMSDFQYEESYQYKETPVNFEEKYSQIVGVTIDEKEPEEDIYFAVKPNSIPYIETKWIHNTQIQIVDENEREIKNKFPFLNDCNIYSISCRLNYELISRIMSYGENIIVFEMPIGKGEYSTTASRIKNKVMEMAKMYEKIENASNK